MAAAVFAVLVVVPTAGTSTYSSPQNYSTGSGTGPSGIGVGDLNGDGKPDLVTANATTGSISVLLNAGDGTFPAHTTYTQPLEGGYAPQTFRIVVADVNADGKADVVASDPGNSHVTVFLGNGDGTLQAGVDYPTDTQPEGVQVADVDGDGKPDIVTANDQGQDVSVLLGNGDGTFQAAQNYPTGTAAKGLAVGDLNGDGHPDLVVAGSAYNKFSVMLNAGDGTFPSHTDHIVTGPDVVAIGDLNGDGHPDIAYASSTVVGTAINNGSGGFTVPNTTYSIPGSAWGMAAADVNGDGKLDLAIANLGSGNVSLLLGKGDGTFQAAQNLPADNNPEDAALADLNGDGHLDLAVPNASSDDVSVILQQLSSDANLSDLGVSDGTLGPMFDPAVTSYSDVVDSSVSQLEVTPTVDDPTATVKVRVNGGSYSTVTSGAQSSPLALNAGDNTVDVLVTAEDGSTQTYSIDVTRLQPYQCAPTPTYPCWTQFTVDGGDPPAGVELQVADAGSNIGVQLVRNDLRELSPALGPNSDVHAEILLGSYDPVVFSTVGKVLSYQETTGSGTNYVDLDISPTASSWSMSSCTVNQCGSDQSPVTATQDYSAVSLGAISDLGALGSTVQDQMRGTWIASNAQAFGIPTFASGQFNFEVAAPHFKTDGSTVNTGFFQAFLPDGIVQSMGIADPSSITSGDLQVGNSNGGTVPVDVSHDDTTGGVLVQSSAPFDYSSPTFTITQAADHLVVTTDASANAGDPLDVQVQALDAQGDVVQGYTGTVHFSGGGANAILPPDYTFTAGDSGTHTFSGVVLEQAGEQTITATDGPVTGTTAAISVSPGPAFKLAVSPVDAVPYRGQSSLSAQVEDAYGNVETDDNSTVVSFADAFGDGSVAGLHDATASGGVVNEDLLGTGSGTVVVSASADGLAGASTQFEVLAKDGSGTMTASPTKIKHGTRTIVTLTFTAAKGGMDDGTLWITVPAGWTAPTANPSRPGYPIATVGTVGVVLGRTITVDHVTLAAGQKVTILFDRKGTVTAPGSPVGAQKWIVGERSSSGGKLLAASSPVITVN